MFSLGLALTVAPLTATVLADADESDAGIASAVNNAVARVAGLIGVSVIGVVIASTLVGDTFAPNAESVRAFHEVVVICAVLVAAGGVAGAIGIANPGRTVTAESCPGGQLVGAPEAVGDSPEHAPNHAPIGRQRPKSVANPCKWALFARRPRGCRIPCLARSRSGRPHASVWVVQRPAPCDWKQ